MSVKDSACSVDKTIYRTIVVTSIALLVFFVASKAVEKEQQEKRKRDQLTAEVHTSSNVANPIMLRMRLH